VFEGEKLTFASERLMKRKERKGKEELLESYGQARRTEVIEPSELEKLVHHADTWQRKGQSERRNLVFNFAVLARSKIFTDLTDGLHLSTSSVSRSSQAFFSELEKLAHLSEL